MLGLATAAGLSLAACSRDSGSSTTPTLSNTDVVAIAADAYVFGYPLVLLQAIADASGPVNRFLHSETLVSAANRLLPKGSVDTLYSLAWLDLATEPMVLQVPPMDPGRYWVLQVLDAWTNTLHDPSSSHSGTGHAEPPFTYLISGPKWSGTVPAGLTHLPMPTQAAALFSRIEINGPADLPAVHAIQERMRLAPLHTWLADPAAPTPGLPLTSATLSNTPTVDVIALDARRFFDRLCELMAIDAPAAADAPAMKRFATIGIKPGGNVDSLRLTDLDTAAAAARKAMRSYVDPAERTVNGWHFYGNLGFFGTNYRLRATAALKGLGTNLPRDVLYPTYEGIADDNGTPRRFRLRFEPGGLPPVNAFWSLTAYDADHFLVDNPADIFVVGHPIPPVHGPDGSVEIAVQNANPGSAVPPGNWLPIPVSGAFSLTMRLYAPKPEAADGRWQPPELKPMS
ncbi:DUF1254 domain-containing protein [Nocardia sp. SYP-A9097]|nr:DUF1254 domain-containing protein [Nocardia sp. SYP-A9097]